MNNYIAKRRRIRNQRWAGMMLVAIAMIIAAGTVLIPQPARYHQEARQEQREFRQCMAGLDTAESRCLAATPNRCTMNAAEWSRYQAQREQRAAMCR